MVEPKKIIGNIEKKPSIYIAKKTSFKKKRENDGLVVGFSLEDRKILENVDDIFLYIEEKLSPDERRNLEIVIEFTKKLSKEFSESFQKELKSQFISGRVSSRMLEVLKEKRLDRPRFDIYDMFHRDEFFDKNRELIGYDSDFPGYYLVFRLPKPGDYWWKKADYYGEDKNQGMYRKMVVEWGVMQRESVLEMHEVLDNLKSERIRDQWVDMERINPVKMHKSGEYYYVWKVWPYKKDG